MRVVLLLFLIVSMSRRLKSPSGRVDTSSLGSASTEGSYGLRPWVKKTLAKDIQRRGGLQSLTGKGLQRLLDSSDRKDTYGEVGDPVRRQITNKVNRWKKLTKDQWRSRVLLNYGIAENPSSSEEDEDNSTVSSLGGGDSDAGPDNQKVPAEIRTETVAPAPKTTKTVAKTPTKTRRRASKKTPSTKTPLSVASPSAVAKTVSPILEEKEYLLSRKEQQELTMASTLPGGFHPVTVDVNKPENNREFVIYDLDRTVPGVGKDSDRLFHGFRIFRKIDVRFTLDDPKVQHYRLRVSAYDELTFTEPAWDYTHLHNRDEFAGQDNCGDITIDAMDNAHDSYGKTKDARKDRHYKLKFPISGVKLSAKAINEKAGEDEDCAMLIVPIEWTHKLGIKGTDYYAAFTVARVDITSRKKGKHVDEDEELSEAAAQLKALGIGDAMEQGNSTTTKKQDNNKGTTKKKAASPRKQNKRKVDQDGRSGIGALDDPDIVLGLIPVGIRNEIEGLATEEERIAALNSYLNGRMALLPAHVQASVLKEPTTEAKIIHLFAVFETGQYDEFEDL